MLVVNERIHIPLDEFQWSFVRASGPGGQNVNKVASKAVLRWPILTSPSLPDEVRQRLLACFPNRVTVEGDCLITSQRFRDREKNRQDCLDKLAQMLREAAEVPPVRRATRIPLAAKARRIASKRHDAARRAARQVERDD